MNEEMLDMLKQKRCLMDTPENRRGKIIGPLKQTLEHTLGTILEGKIKCRRGRAIHSASGR